MLANHVRWARGSRCVLSAVLGLTGLLVSMQTRACEYRNWSSQTYNLSDGSATINVPRDAAPATPVHTIRGPTYSNMQDFAYCGDPASRQQAEVLTNPRGWLDQANKIFKTGVQGIGVRIRTAGGAYYPVANAALLEPPPAYVHWIGTPIFQYEFVKTGPVVGVGTVTGADLPQVRYVLTDPAVQLEILRTIPSVSVTFVSQACTTADVAVDLGRQKRQDFTGVGSRTGTKVFDVELNACPSGMNAIDFSLSSPAGVNNAANGVINLASGSTAAGVGIQVRYGDAPVQYGTKYTIGAYGGGAGAYRIPLEAAYYQTEAGVKPGTANGMLEFTLIYR